ncbi:TRAP transporter large permease [Carboxydochorda subterranea]|uniref:TRAP transporter large permease n=1 Tax=Carboxydichorda subterranea TaxID=3109565 RepID=A0ABZ1BVP4_9FIRM|nr:TRAP transporter large permease [Limnochorda sp. L945t]WRP16857.1 TRAP transporter large permease [Limnochorda sp. L945t]
MSLVGLDPLLVLLGSFGLLVALQVPIAFALGLSGAAVLYTTQMGFRMLADLMFANIAKFSLLAIPFFILAGVIMGETGIAERIVRFVKLLVGQAVGGLAVVTVLVGMFWGAVSGSGPASVAALGPILIPAMGKEGYERSFATSITCMAAALAIVIPPSIALVVYGVLAETSIARLFLAGIVPGVLVGLFLIGYAVWLSRKHGWRGGTRGSWRDLWIAGKDAFWGLLTPAIILGGVYGGVVTPTEAAVVAVMWGLFVGGVIYRTLTVAKLYRILVEAATSSAVVMLVVAFAGVFAWVMATQGIVDRMAQALLSIASNPVTALLVINLLLLILGMLMDAISIMYITLPILLPVARHFGWDPVWFGLVVTVNLAIGLVTPPVGINLYVGAHIAGVPFDRLASRVWPIVAVSVAALLLLTYVPEITLWLPRLVMG